MADPLIPPRVSALAARDARGLAVFDADGVLWEGDVAEDFALWMIGEGAFDGRLWPVYQRCVAEDEAAGCFFMPRFYAGMEGMAIRAYVERFWRAAPRAWLTRVHATAQWVRQQGFTVFVVSATPAPVLGPLARALPVDAVLALELELDDDGRATGRSAGIATVGPGKAERIRAESGAPVRLAAGNSALDAPMLRLSTGVAWAVNPDAELRDVARELGWLITVEGPA